MDTYYEIVDGKIVPNPSKKDSIRIQSLKIPPNWKNVKVSKDSSSKVQVIGRDSKDREQRIYNVEWIKQSNQLKYKNMNILSKKYKQFDEYLDKLIRKKDLSLYCVVANIIKLLILLNIRVGNEVYFEENGTCGITTLRKENVKIIDSEYFIEFTGKKGIEHSKHIKSLRIKNFIDKMLKIKNDRLFCYEKECEVIPVTSCDVNQFIKDNLGENFTSKDLRTYSANKIFKEQLSNFGNPKNEKDASFKIREAIKFTAKQLGNTPKVCKDSYIDPNIITKYNKRGLTTHY